MRFKGVVLLLATGAAFSASHAFCADEKYVRQAEIRFPGKAAVKAEIVWTPQDTQKGLMFRDKLAHDRGMLFVFEEELLRAFWMKNTWLDLDIIYIGGNNRILRIFPKVSRSYKGMPDLAVARVEWVARYVLEVNAGFAARHKLAEGDTVVFDLSPSRKEGVKNR